MKNIYTILFIGVICAWMSSCLKGSGNPSPAALRGKWHIVNDSTITNFWGLWAGRPAVGTNFVGGANDYFNFLADGKVYVQEGNTADTATIYKLKSNNALEIDYLSMNGYVDTSLWREDYTVSNFTAHTLKLTGGVLVTPETAYTHVINLTR